MKILIITHYNFGSKSHGAINRVLGLAKVMSKYASIKIIHRGSNKVLGNLQFIGYNSMFSFDVSNWISDAISPYVSFAFPDFYRVVKRAIEDADVVQIEQPYLLLPTLSLIKALGKDPLIVLDEHNVDFMSVKSKISGFSHNSLLSMMTIPYVFLVEKLAVKNADLVLCVSQVDQELLMKIYGVPGNKLVVIPNGVDIGKFEKPPPANYPPLSTKSVFFHGSLNWYPNIEAANIIVDFIAPKIPEATFIIAGANPLVSFIKKLNKAKNVKYVGFLKDLERWIKYSDVCIAPILRGGGTKLKVLEYAAAGKPIVATYKAVEGLPFINGVHALLFKDISMDFVNAIKRVLSNDVLAKNLCSNARRLALNFDWEEIGRRLYEEYRSLVARKKK